MRRKPTGSRAPATAPLPDRPDDLQEHRIPGVGRRAPLHVEIGCGLGNALLRRARWVHPESCVGVEIVPQRAETARRAVQSEPNADVIVADAIQFLESTAVGSLRSIHVYFPTPFGSTSEGPSASYQWMSGSRIDLVKSRLAPYGEFVLVTDAHALFVQTLEWVRKSGLVEAPWRAPFGDIPDGRLVDTPCERQFSTKAHPPYWIRAVKA